MEKDNKLSLDEMFQLAESVTCWEDCTAIFFGGPYLGSFKGVDIKINKFLSLLPPRINYYLSVYHNSTNVGGCLINSQKEDYERLKKFYKTINQKIKKEEENKIVGRVDTSFKYVREVLEELKE